ncbi:metallophosphoesterase [Streptosporangium sp. NBC_01639]|uniref:metallophosphoesterase family protein n=1 Tax=unclassified Streptosporangium TaxID=2632669 RepID=UPI002DD98AD9|nr:metallophosphoesterase [Streptosporangium sp. NBC_01756]WSC88638.1 metallophosphoesterase [Streptosporangium sp. NBC_01756]WTD52666.1 metallophosphoesterase [Streptosporangium sp. NBC_01639]
MTNGQKNGGRLLAVSDLHVAHQENRQIVKDLRPGSEADWLLVAGDVGELASDIEWTLTLLKERFSTVIWTPGNHELWTPPYDSVDLRGEQRYRYLVEMCRRLGVVTPEDDYPVWTGAGGPVTIAPLFLLYDYTFRPPGMSQEEAMKWAHESGVVCTDEYLLHPEPYPHRAAWCHARIRESQRRLAERDTDIPTILVNHWPLTSEPTRVLRYPQFAQWCGTEHTYDWHRRYDALAVVYGHLHIPRTTWQDGVRFEEVSLGYPREWRRWNRTGSPIRSVLPYREIS